MNQTERAVVQVLRDKLDELETPRLGPSTDSIRRIRLHKSIAVIMALGALLVVGILGVSAGSLLVTRDANPESSRGIEPGGDGTNREEVSVPPIPTTPRLLLLAGNHAGRPWGLQGFVGRFDDPDHPKESLCLQFFMEAPTGDDMCVEGWRQPLKDESGIQFITHELSRGLAVYGRAGQSIQRVDLLGAGGSRDPAEVAASPQALNIQGKFFVAFTPDTSGTLIAFDSSGREVNRQKVDLD
jgi:hypothetical protein